MVVAKPRTGWVMSTSGLLLIDRSFLRYTGHDVQLDASVRELLEGIPVRAGASSTSRAKAKSTE